MKGSKIGILLEELEGIAIDQSLKFSFKASNNQAEYKGLIAGLQLVKKMGADSLTVKSDF